MILGNNDVDKAVRGKAKDASSDVNARLIKWDASLHSTFTTSELALALIDSINALSL